MKPLIIGAVLVAFSLGAWGAWEHRPSHAIWDGQRFSCADGRAIWADESEALAGKPDYVYCIELRSVAVGE